MKALTLHQPWATLIALGVKTVETRSWKAPDSLIGERFAIHAAKRIIKDGERFGGWRTWRRNPLDWLAPAGEVEPAITGNEVELPRGAVVATARLTDCLPMVHDDGCPHLSWMTDEMIEGGCLAIDPEVDDDLAAYALTIWTQGQDGLLIDTPIGDQLPYGDFAPGRWAWMLDGIEPLPEPVLATGRQRLWNWEATP